MAKVLVQKVNCGLALRFADERGAKPRGAVKQREALYRAFDQWHRAAYQVAYDAGVGLYNVEHARFVYEGDGVATMHLEPWGFAWGTLEDPQMNDSGSTPTESRARLLLCYQAPLERIEQPDGRVRHERTYEV